MKKLISASLCLAMLTGLGACGESAPADVTDTTSQPESTAPEQELRFDGAEFNILYINNTGARNLLIAEEETGDAMNDAIYRRNLAVLDDLGVTVNYIPAEADSTSDPAARIRQSVSAGDDDYQMAVIHRVDGIADLASGGYLTNYADLPHVSLDAEWWNRRAMDIMSFDSKSYFGYNDLYPISTFCVYFNKELVEKYQLGNIYSLVYDGKWTVDAMMEMAKKGAEDLNGDGNFTREDQFGIAIRNVTILSGFYFGAGIPLTQWQDGRVQLSLYSERMLKLFEKTYPVLADPTVSYMEKQDDLTIRSGQILFYLDSLDNANGHRTSDIEFGLLPYPKFDEAQKEYISFANPNLQCVPSAIKDPEMVGAVIEYMAKNSGEITDAFYEKTLKGKVSSDEDSAAMVDIMMDNYVVDFAGNYCGFSTACTKLYNCYYWLLHDRSDAFTSFYNEWAVAAQAEIDAVLEGIGKSEAK